MRRWLPVIFIAGALIFSAAVYSRLPERVPVHWNISGEPDRFGTRLEGAFFLPVVMIIMLTIMRWFPTLDPRGANIARFRTAYDTIVATMVAFMAAVHVLVLGNSLGWTINITTVALVGLGVLIMVLGNVLPIVRSNFIFGIRTPWTLSSERVWTRAHRVGGYTMVAGGLVVVISAFLPQPLGVFVALSSLLTAAIVPIVYSYVLWARERGGPSNNA